MEVLDLNPSPEEPGMCLEQTGRTRPEFSVDIAKDPDRHCGRQRQNLFQKPDEAEEIGGIGAGDDDRIAAARPRRHGGDRGIKQRVPPIRNELPEAAASSSLRCTKVSAGRMASSSIASMSS